MALPLSRTQIEKLGKRLVAVERPDPEDVKQLNELLIAYRHILSVAAKRVEAVSGLTVTSRVKTRGTTLDKLRKQGGHRLPAIQDLAGMRVISLGSRTDQDDIVERLCAEFAAEAKPPHVVDRRGTPSFGYRAVHVVVYPEKVPVEIQVRTHRQHEWADLYEKLADLIGRGIRYGEPPLPRWAGIDDVLAAYADDVGEAAPPELIAAAQELMDLNYAHREAMVEQAGLVSDVIALAEEAEAIPTIDAAGLEEQRETVAWALATLRKNVEALAEDSGTKRR